MFGGVLCSNVGESGKQSPMKAKIIKDGGTVSAGDLALKYRTSIVTIHSWRKRGVIPTKISEGRVVRFDPEAVEQALEERAAKRGGAQ